MSNRREKVSRWPLSSRTDATLGVCDIKLFLFCSLWSKRQVSGLASTSLHSSAADSTCRLPSSADLLSTSLSTSFGFGSFGTAARVHDTYTASSLSTGTKMLPAAVASSGLISKSTIEKRRSPWTWSRCPRLNFSVCPACRRHRWLIHSRNVLYINGQ